MMIGLGIWGMLSWWSVFGLVMRGLVPFFLLLVGSIALLAGSRRLSLAAAGAREAEPPTSEPEAEFDMAEVGHRPFGA